MTNQYLEPSKKEQFQDKSNVRKLAQKSRKSLINVLTLSRISPENVWKNDGQFQNFSGQFYTSITHSDMCICCRVILASFSWMYLLSWVCLL